ncbi:MAG: sialate O-acetylesterase [Planctomycetota bacterium]|jgi:alpha-galactosidase
MERRPEYMNVVSICTFLIALAFPAKVLSEQPVKVFILAGQSNMEGQGEMTSGAQGNLTYLVQNDPDGTFEHLVDNGGNWVVRDDVWFWYKRGGTTIVKGGLSAGQGVNDHCIGPELQFGHLMGDAFDNQVLLIKTAWGGKSLAVDFRPPSSGGTVGPFYTEMLDIVADVLANLSTHFNTYNGQGYEIVGFGWHQGWNDRVNQTFNDEYEFNMANFIRDVRNDLGIPNLPFVIATTGMSGWEETHPRALSLMEAQLAMADFDKYPEFEGNVAVVETRDYYRPASESPSSQGYHWNRNAETYFLIGNGMGEEMDRLLARKDIRVLDFNRDGNVNFADFCSFIAYLDANDPMADIAPLPFGDDRVDITDVAAFIEYWLSDVLISFHWRLDEAEGDVAADGAGDKDGLLHGDPNWLTAGGSVGGALELDGIDDYVSTDYILDPVEGPFSIYAWVKGGGPGQVVISQANGTGIGWSWLCADSAGKLMTDLRPKAGRLFFPPLVSDFAIPDDAWCRIGLVWDGTQRYLYADGTQIAKDSEPQPQLSNATGGLYFGASNTLAPETHWLGLIDDIRIYETVVVLP